MVLRGRRAKGLDTTLRLRLRREGERVSRMGGEVGRERVTGRRLG
jgi:hypothetical protein